MVGVNEFVSPAQPYQPLRVDESVATTQRAKLEKLRRSRDEHVLQTALSDLQQAAGSDTNVMPIIKRALLAQGTVGEISNALRKVWGNYRAPESW